ncbi:adenylate/guanylate cyclase domain-containing protein [Tateyamaria sp. SN3-11]|uniref:adenylate/guanylate cyclase domain-containing protein n=1 Tax=Tateyamaria sp. SN3-11 TaxID=3092147 RepID=UPI0039EAFFAA
MIDKPTATFALKVIAFSMCIGALTPLIFADGYERPVDAVVGGMTGLLIGAGCLTVELTFLSNQSIRWLRQTPLVTIIGFRTITYSLIIVVGIVAPARVLLDQKLWQEPEFAFNFVISAAIASAISTSIELLRLLGREATLAIFTGQYRRPRLENRIVLFADLVGSTSLAERLGELRFHEFLSDVSYDLSLPIESNGGEVHRYVGDAVIVTWSAADPKNNERSVGCATQMLAALESKTEEYITRYGQEAKIRVALHCGPVAAGEIGTWKKEIALLGDTMNTAARIESAARDFGVEVVISDAVKEQLPSEVSKMLSQLPNYHARGKSNQLALWTISE